MKNGTKVKWELSYPWQNQSGHGVVIGDEDDTGHVAVAVQSEPGPVHRVIWCTVTWLTVVEAPAAPAPSAAPLLSLVPDGAPAES